MTQLYALLGLIGGTVIAVLAIVFRLLNVGKASQKAADQEQQIQDEQAIDNRVADSLNADSRVRDDIAHGGLRTDDGHKRAN